jgi:hypothetical protein
MFCRAGECGERCGRVFSGCFVWGLGKSDFVLLEKKKKKIKK